MINFTDRIDRNTIGLVLFAKNDIALNILFDKFKKHEIKKSYTALVYGIPKIKNSRLEAYLFKDNKSATMKLLPPTKMKSFSVASLWAAFSAVATSG